ncbi:MAG: FecR domain-containing protein [Roseateles sp.]
MRALVLCLSLLGSAAWAQPACEVAAVQGEALQADGRPLAAGDRLDVGATLRTGAAGRVRLRCSDGSVVVLADRSQLRIVAYAAPARPSRAAELLLELGLVGQRVTPQAGGSWRVRTPTAVTAVRGTEFSVEVADDRATAVHLRAGEVEVAPLDAPQATVRLTPALNGTRCDASRCDAATAWRAERVARVAQRLGALD